MFWFFLFTWYEDDIFEDDKDIEERSVETSYFLKDFHRKVVSLYHLSLYSITFMAVAVYWRPKGDTCITPRLHCTAITILYSSVTGPICCGWIGWLPNSFCPCRYFWWRTITMKSFFLSIVCCLFKRFHFSHTYTKIIPLTKEREGLHRMSANISFIKVYRIKTFSLLIVIFIFIISAIIIIIVYLLLLSKIEANEGWCSPPGS